MSSLTGERPEGLKSRFESFSFHRIPDKQGGEIGFYDEGGPEPTTGARCEDGDSSGRDPSLATAWFR
jgi:hypothetical protein